MSYQILTDSDIDAIDMTFAVNCMEDAFRQHATGQLIAPARLVSDVASGQLVFTVGASNSARPAVGFRVYDLKQLHSPDRSELTAVFDANDGHLRALVIGPLLGAVRTGAIGGVAVNYLARRDARTLSVIGTGFQARTQIQAATTVRSFKTIKVFSRHPIRRRQFSAEMSDVVAQEIIAADSARAAVDDADVVICATTSATPILKPEWLKPGIHINAIGPKFKDRSELSLNTIERATRLVTDSPTQIEAFGESFSLHGTPMAERIETLSAVVAETVPTNRGADETTIFISLGLAGTEVLLADAICDLMAG